MADDQPHPFFGLSAFPLTPTDEHGCVDTDTLGRLLERLCMAQIGSVGLLGTTGIYAYLTRQERHRAVEAAVECISGRVPLVVGVGALKTDYASELARDAESAGADAILMAPMSYTPLTEDEVYEHYRSVAAVTRLPLCIYNNPGTTHFSFSIDLLERLSRISTIRAVKMPLPTNRSYAEELAVLRSRTGLAVGYSGDWGMADAMLSGADAFYSALGGILPVISQSLLRSATGGDAEEVQRIAGLLTPLLETFKTYGSLRVIYALLELLDLGTARPLPPVLPLGPEARERVAEAVKPLQILECAD